MHYPIIEHHGAKDGVTGSCHQLHMNASTSVLIDCGLFQGNDASLPGGAGEGQLAIEFPLDMITYGDRLHEDRQNRRKRLEAVIEQALEDQGTVLIPAFSIGRTQELLYELEEIIQAASPNTVQPPLPSGERVGVRGKANNINVKPDTEPNWPELPVILDSPLASRFTETYRSLKPFWNQEARDRIQSGRRPLAFEQLITIDSHGDHQRIVNHLTQTARPAIVIAGGGMCSGGRIVNYLKAILGDKRHNVLFVGYQAKGTPGHAIQTYGPKGGYVDLDGERIDIRAGITSIGGYSAHADQKGLVEFVTGMQEWPSEIRVVHGEDNAKHALTAQLQATYKQQNRAPAVVVTGGT